MERLKTLGRLGKDSFKACPVCEFICPADTPGMEHDCLELLSMTVITLKDCALEITEHAEKAKAKVKLLRELVSAVKSSEFDGISCEDVSTGNWFDAKDQALADTKEAEVMLLQTVAGEDYQEIITLKAEVERLEGSLDAAEAGEDYQEIVALKAEVERLTATVSRYDRAQTEALEEVEKLTAIIAVGDALRKKQQVEIERLKCQKYTSDGVSTTVVMK